ncbi:MAG: hypothetical protein LUD00_07410 [Prevotellaceae bacterium]|nr:hypothetical protein [Prevotellaceae bacterium]
MKHKLLLFGASILASASAMAQWTQPVPTASELKVSEGTDTVVYYLYNRDAKAFFTEGNQWGTQASVGKEGLKVFISKYIPAVEEGEEAEPWDGKTYLFNDSSIAKNAWKQVFIDSETVSYVDRGSQPNYFWEIAAGADKTYRLYGAEINPTYNKTNYAGAYFGLDISTDAANTAISPLLFKSDEGTAGTYCVDWQFVTEADYAAYQEKFVVYDAAMSLKTMIDKAKEKGVNTSAAEAVFANTNSTKEQLEAAQVELKQAIAEALENSASPEKPLDMTAEYVGNSTFEDNADGWSFTTGAANNGLATNKTDEDAQNGGTNFTGKFWENWNPSSYKGKMYKVINNVPNGIYCLQMGAFSDDVTAAYVYANNDSVLVPSSAPATYKVWTVVDADSIEIGLKKSEVKGQWMGIDNVVLTYYGNSLDSYKMYIANITTPAEEYEKDGVYVQQAVLDAYKAELAKAQGATTKEDILACAPAVYEAYNNVVANANAYAAYVDAKNSADKYFEEHTDLMGDDVELVTWYLMSEDGPDETDPNGGAKYILENCQLSTEEILAETEFLETLRLNAINNGMGDGTDCTALIVNPTFNDASGKGWTWTDGVAKTGGLSDYPCAEAYERAFDVYQDVTIQDGLYEVSVNAFYRPGGNGSYDGTEAVPAEIYLNEFATPVQHIMADCSEECAYDSGNWMTDYETPNGWVPNSMNGASTAFKAGRYKQTVYGLVSGGKLRLGIRSTATSGGARWCLWTNFKLIYRAKNAEALAFVINSVVEDAQALMEEGMFAADLDALQVAIANAQDAKDGDAMYDALIALNASIVNAKASTKAYVALSDALDNLGEAMSVYEGTASDEALSKADELSGEIEANMEDYTAADAEGKIAEIKNVIAHLRVPDGSEASDENPIDFTQVIENPAFDEGNADGWDYSSFTQGNRGYQGATYTNPESEATCSQFIEAWRGSNTPLEDAEIVQALAYLPAGGYALEVDIIACNQGAAPDAVTEGAYLFAQEGENAASMESVHSGSGVPEHFTLYFTKQEADSKVTIGIRTVGTTANWICADNFKLTYYGTDSQVSIDGVTPSGAEVVAVEYYTLGGVRVATPQKGVNILKATLSDGTVKVSKVIF